MKIIRESPEHHFLTFLERLKSDASGWLGCRVAFSEKLSHADIIAKPEHIKGKLFRLHEDSDDLAKEMESRFKNDGSALLYQFADSDIVIMLRPGNDAARDEAKKLFTELQTRFGKKICESCNLAKDIYSYQKLADARFLTAARVKAYEAMADSNRTQSISLRRERRDDAVIMIVEDDRFTASYAANILNKDYDIVLAKTGEEAISLYIEHAPDMVFLDIHLPGLDGIDTLRAIRRVDSDSFIFMLSVDTVKQNIVAARKEGAAGFLKKPFGKERLMAAVVKSPFIKRLQSRVP